MATVYLCQVTELDNTYQHVIDFKSRTNQNTWFNQKVIREVETQVQIGSTLESIVVPLNLSTVKLADYLFIQEETTARRFFYFIKERQFKTASSTTLTVELDVYSTYLFDHEIMNSFIERCHVPRWNGSIPSNETVDEGFPQFDYMLASRESVASTSQSYIITSIEPLGVVGDDSGSGGGSGAVGDLDAFPDSRKFSNSYGVWLVPTIGQTTAIWGNYEGHTGIDWAWNKGTSIVASRSGTVKYVNLIDPGASTPNYGKYLTIDHGDGLLSLYGHCDTINVSVGDYVQVGEQIATMGNTGYVISLGGDGTHLHFELRSNNVAFNPDPSTKFPIGSYIET